MPTKRMSSNEAKQQWGTLIKSVRDSDDAVIVESHGTPVVAVIPYDEFMEYRMYNEQRRRQELLKRLDQIEANYDGRNDHLTEEQINDISVKIGREINGAAAERHRQRVAQSKQHS
jgi:prevent-host-death family protein